MAEQFGILVRIAVLVVATLLPLINPAGSAAIFHSMTLGISDAARRKMAWQIGLNSFFLVVAATFVGSYVLDFFGVSLTSVRIGGGLLVAASGWKLLNADEKAGPVVTDVKKVARLARVLSDHVPPDRRARHDFRGNHDRRQSQGAWGGPMAEGAGQLRGIGDGCFHGLLQFSVCGEANTLFGYYRDSSDVASFGVHPDVRWRADCYKCDPRHRARDRTSLEKGLLKNSF
jgi:hypothetical protein